MNDEDGPFQRRVSREVWAMILNRLDEGDDPLSEPDDETDGPPPNPG